MTATLHPAITEYKLQRMQAELDMFRSWKAPEPKPGETSFSFQHPELGLLECHIEYEPALPPSLDDPGEPVTCDLMGVWARGLDISDRIHDGEKFAIESAFLKELKQ